jgi:Major Facilitator Superfamily
MTRIDPPPQAGPSGEGARPADRLVNRVASFAGPGLVRLVRNTLRLSSDRDRHGADAFTASPFSRLQLTQMLSLGADAMVTVALAGSLFFSISTHSARGRVALTLLITIAPFAVVAPLIGPLIDRMNGGRRAMIVVSAIGRAVACLFMARYIHGLGLFPAALLSLICSKTYSVAKAAIVPAVVVRNEDLVEANSKLAMAGAVAGFLAYVPGVPILKLFNAATVLRVDIVLYILCALSALRLQARPGASLTDTSDDPEKPVAAHVRRLSPGALTAAALAMAALRFTVGFMVFLVAFAFRRTHAPVWWYGIALAGSVGGNLVGAAIAPRLKGRIKEEHILLSSVLVVAAVGLLTIPVDILQRRPAASLLAVAVGLAAGTAKLAFDSLVQQDVPTARQGRAFGRFEAIFQLVWVLGGLVPVAIAMSLRVGDLAVTVLLAASAVIYLVANRLAALERLPHWWPGVAAGPGPLAPEKTVIGGAVGLPTDPAFPVADPTAPAGGPVAPEAGGPVMGDPVSERPDPGTSPGLARPPRLGPPPPLGGGAPAQ